MPNSSICTTPRIRARVSDSLLMHDTGVPGTVRTTRPVTYEYHQVHSFMYDWQYYIWQIGESTAERPWGRYVGPQRQLLGTVKLALEKMIR